MIAIDDRCGLLATRTSNHRGDSECHKSASIVVGMIFTTQLPGNYSFFRQVGRNWISAAAWMCMLMATVL